tara:strand:+ start:1531 stop:1791 length:261 start_codon:yes stop_codon:yes gene_type:complete
MNRKKKPIVHQSVVGKRPTTMLVILKAIADNPGLSRAGLKDLLADIPRNQVAVALTRLHRMSRIVGMGTDQIRITELGESYLTADR